MIDAFEVGPFRKFLIKTFSKKPIRDMIENSKDENYEFVKHILINGIHPDSTIDDLPTALCVAAGTGNLEICKLLIEFGADVDRTDARGLNAITYAWWSLQSYKDGSISNMFGDNKTTINKLEITVKYLREIASEEPLSYDIKKIGEEAKAIERIIRNTEMYSKNK